MAVFTANDVACYGATCEMLGDADLRAALPTFKMPVAVVVGDEDVAVHRRYFPLRSAPGPHASPPPRPSRAANIGRRTRKVVRRG